ncbi:MAG TPA: hypothetical protein PK720_00075 [bacterium]|jgi:hypothetical protein|nr:hypothetical protein [bacterium]
MVRGIILIIFKVKEVKNELNDKIYFTSFPRYKETEEACNISDLQCFGNSIEILSENIFGVLNCPSDQYHPDHITFHFSMSIIGNEMKSIYSNADESIELSADESEQFKIAYNKLCLGEKNK